MYSFSRRSGLPDVHSINHPAFLAARRRYGRLRRPPELEMAEQAPILGPETRSYMRDMLLETATPAALAPRPEQPLQVPVAPELTYEDYRAQPPSLRFANIPIGELSPYEINELADEMADRRKAEEAEKFATAAAEVKERYDYPPEVSPGVTELSSRMYTPEERGRRVRAIDLLRLHRGRATPEQVAGSRQARWGRAPELFPARPEIERARQAGVPGFLPEHRFIAPDLEEDIGRFERMLPPDLQAARAQRQYAIEHPEAPTLPRYETTVTRRMPGGVTLTHKPISAPELSTELEVEQIKARLAAEQARKAYWERPATTTPSPIMRMVNEGLLTLDEGKGLAIKEKGGDLTEKDIISIMHTIERALAATYTPLNEPLEGGTYEERRGYYTQQLEAYQNRLDQIRAGKAEPARVKVKAPDGTIGTLPASQVSEAVKAGYQVITD